MQGESVDLGGRRLIKKKKPEGSGINEYNLRVIDSACSIYLCQAGWGTTGAAENDTERGARLSRRGRRVELMRREPSIVSVESLALPLGSPVGLRLPVRPHAVSRVTYIRPLWVTSRCTTCLTPAPSPLIAIACSRPAT